MRTGLVGLAVTLFACTPPAPPPAPAPQRSPSPTSTSVTISVVGTNDLHGNLAALPVLAGYLANLRAVRAASGGGVVLVDGGDMFQGTLESNLVEGASVVAAYNALGYAAVAIGNHEFDFGPVGERTTPAPADDPRGALKARAAEARFPFLAANLIDERTRRRVDWPNTAATHTVAIGGVTVGIVGVTTTSTPHTTIAPNVAGLRIAPLARTIVAEATALRKAGAAIVVVAAHAGGSCRALDRPTDAAACDADEEIMRVARALPAGLVDVIVAGHTHAGMAHEIAGVAIIESFSKGVAFGRVDLVVEGGRVVRRAIHPPRDLCERGARKPRPDAPCAPGSYEGRPVVAEPAIAAIVARYQAEADRIGAAPLGVTVERRIERAYGTESALGNLFADLMLAARPVADVALTNGGGLRADLATGPLTYGALYEAMPFDNRFALVELRAGELATLLADNLRSTGGILSIAGVRATARCAGGPDATVELTRADGTPIPPRRRLTVATSDFLASGGDGLFGRLELPSRAIQVEEGVTIRDEMARVLRERGGVLRGDALVDKARPRLVYEGRRPVRCAAPAAAP